MKTFLLSAAFLALQIATAQAPTGESNPLATSRAFRYEDMVVRSTPNGGEGRRVFTGTLPTGEAVGAHETTQPVDAAPSALHKIQHSELIVVQQGTVEFHHDGKVERVTAGGILYVAIGTEHFVQNGGDIPAKYVVIQIGGDTKE
jgi:mannose-6-phosphate isomerase-like protein (cupin superfamily)